MWMDFRTWRISNWLILCGLLIGLLFQVWQYQVKGIVTFIVQVSVPIILLYLLFLMRALGAGDIKLFSVISGIWNLKIAFITMGAAFFVAAVLSLWKLICQKNLFARLRVCGEYLHQVMVTGKITKYPRESKGKQNIIHFSVAILIGFFIACEVVY